MMRLTACGCRSLWCLLDAFGHAIPLEPFGLIRHWICERHDEHIRGEE